jgi:putative transposase
MQRISLKYRIYPTKAQTTKLNKTLSICRDVYNSLVNERTALYDQGLKSPTHFSQCVAITSWKDDHEELKIVYAQSVQNVAVRVDIAFKAFFRRSKAGETPGYPRLKGIGQYDSFTYPQATGFKVGESTVTLGKIGKVKAKIHRSIVGTIKACTVRRYGSKWFVSVTCEYEHDPLATSNETVGIDVGIKSFAALSNGEFIANPKFYRAEEKSLAKASRQQAKTKNGSGDRCKRNKVIRRVHERIRNKRHNFVHQESRKLVNKYGLIAVEKLNVKGMVKNHCLAKSISDASWSMFRECLTYKAESAGRKLIAVNPAYTSQMCSGCGNVVKKKLADRIHFCPQCGMTMDRDTNAAVNILRIAMGQHSVAI